MSEYRIFRVIRTEGQQYFDIEYVKDLVTCAECKFKSLYDGETKYYYCALEDRPNRQWSVDDWNYCYWGERKENER